MAIHRRALAALVFGAGTLFQLCPANAQLFNDPRYLNNFTGVVTLASVNTAQTPPTTTKVFTSPTSISTLLVDLYKDPKNQTALESAVNTAIEQALNKAGGFSLYMSPPNAPAYVLDPAPTVVGFNDPAKRQIGLMMNFKNNSVTIDIATPGPAPTSTNPKVTLTFSAQAAVLITLQNNTPTITDAGAQLRDAHLTADNFTGEIVTALNNLGIIKLPNFDPTTDVPTKVLTELNSDIASGMHVLGPLPGLALVAPTNAIAFQVTTDACGLAELKSVASPCSCLPGAVNLNYPQGCDAYGTAMCLTAAQLSKVPKCAGTTYLVCGNLPAVAARDRFGSWFNKVSLNCVKVPVSTTPASGKSGPPPKGTKLPVSNSQNKNNP